MSDIVKEFCRDDLKRMRRRSCEKYGRLHRFKKSPNPFREGLDRMKRWPTLERRFKGKKVRIWSQEHRAYWGPKSCGYYDHEQAGVFDFDVMRVATGHCGPDKQIYFELIESETTGAK